MSTFYFRAMNTKGGRIARTNNKTTSASYNGSNEIMVNLGIISEKPSKGYETFYIYNDEGNPIYLVAYGKDKGDDYYGVKIYNSFTGGIVFEGKTCCTRWIMSDTPFKLRKLVDKFLRIAVVAEGTSMEEYEAIENKTISDIRILLENFITSLQYIRKKTSGYLQVDLEKCLENSRHILLTEDYLEVLAKRVFKEKGLSLSFGCDELNKSLSWGNVEITPEIIDKYYNADPIERIKAYVYTHPYRPSYISKDDIDLVKTEDEIKISLCGGYVITLNNDLSLCGYSCPDGCRLGFDDMEFALELMKERKYIFSM